MIVWKHHMNLFYLSNLTALIYINFLIIRFYQDLLYVNSSYVFIVLVENDEIKPFPKNFKENFSLFSLKY